MNNFNERDLDPFQEMTWVAQTLLTLSDRGFEESYKSIKPSKVIFDSQFCRISLIFGGWDYLGGNSIHIRYGRLHADDEKNTMTWNGQECYCWHRVEYPLHFLDQRTPIETAKLDYSHPITSPFYSEEIRRKFARQTEWLAEMHVTIWQKYGQRLFDLFDLRRPDIWQQYQQYLKDVYDIAGRDTDIVPPMDHVC